MQVRTVSPADVIASGDARPCKLVDVRTPVEFRAVHAAGAILIPLDEFDPARLRQIAATDVDPIYLLCASGGRATVAAERCDAAGLSNVFVVEGGTNAWVAAGLPVVRGKAAMSLERQVRIAAGSLVLAGVILGWFVHRAFFGVAGFVGAGLIFAGITDTCGMGMVLARMPWNRTR